MAQTFIRWKCFFLKNWFCVTFLYIFANMIEKKITSANAGEEQLRQLYETAFPVEEQIPWNDIIRLIGVMPLDFTAYYDNNEILQGLTIVYPRKQFNWFWYFAVPAELRGKGVGQEILSRLLEKYHGETNILDMESPDQVCENSEQRHRRHGFYLRKGFRDTGVGRSYEGIDYTIMIIGEGSFTMQDYDDIIGELRSFWDKMPKEGTNQERI